VVGGGRRGPRVVKPLRDVVSGARAMNRRRARIRKPLPPEQGLIIVNSSKEKLVTTAPIPAWDLYQGGCIPLLREHFSNEPARRARTRILSAEHGLLHPDDTVTTYDRQLTTGEQADALRTRTVSAQLDAEFADAPELRHLLILVTPLYFLALERVVDHIERLDSVNGSMVPGPWSWLTDGRRVLTKWGWA
jgi:Family of unknown function (DUF6884)